MCGWWSPRGLRPARALWPDVDAPTPTAAHRVESFAIGELPEDVESEAAAAATTFHETPAFGRAFAASGAPVRLVRVLGPDASDQGESVDAAAADTGAGTGPDAARVLGHVLVVEERGPADHGTWVGLSQPALRPATEPRAFFDALFAGARGDRIVTAAWRDITVTRVGAPWIEAARAASDALGGRLVEGDFITHVVDLTEDVDTLWAGLDRKHRNMIRKAERLDVTAGPADPRGFAATYALLSYETWAHSGLKGPSAAYYDALIQAGSPDDRILNYVALDVDSMPVAGAIIVVDGARATYLHGASLPGESTGASTLLQWTIIRDLATRGIHAYDMGGCPTPGGADEDARLAGIRRFKERFGGAVESWRVFQVLIDPEAYAVVKGSADRGAEPSSQAGPGSS